MARTDASSKGSAGGGGSGDVSAAANITDNAIVRGDGGAKGVQDTGVLIDDSDNVSGATSYEGIVLTENADGGQLDAGSTSSRILKWLGAAVTFTGSGTNTQTMPSSSQTLVGRTSTDTLTNKTTTNLIQNGTATGTAIKDEDDMTSDSDTHLSTQQSIKKYHDDNHVFYYFFSSGGNGMTAGRYINWGGSTLTIDDAEMPMPACTVETLFVKRENTSGDGSVTVEKNGVATALSVSLTGTTVSGSDTGSVSFSDGDDLNFNFSEDTPATTGNYRGYIKCRVAG